jgi:PAS domain S-box-containing protein
VAAHAATLRALEAARRELEHRASQGAHDLTRMKERLEIALRGAKVNVFVQDRDLRYIWMLAPAISDGGADMLGRTDEELMPPSERTDVIELKRSVLQTGVPGERKVAYVLPEGRMVVSLHVEPSFDSDGVIDGIISTTRPADDRVGGERLGLTEQLSATVQRYETALRGSHVTVFTQDSNLRYTTISNEFLGLGVDEIIGRTDEEVLPTPSREALISLKRQTLADGNPADHEIGIKEGAAERYFDLHLEPLRDARGEVAGLSCAAVEITERKENEAHLRLLMRELTHRSKNLLAVIQAMARQTARHSGSTEAFIERFNARLQALATSHDLLVQESWYGASLHDLVKLQLGHYLDRTHPQIAFEGPPVLLKPEAAQGLGLGLHELATNAAKYGALCVPDGRVSITWKRQPAAEGHGIELVWQESGGPRVTVPDRRGFGTLVIERHLSRSIDAEVNLDFAPEGVRFRIIVPVTQFLALR